MILIVILIPLLIVILTMVCNPLRMSVHCSLASVGFRASRPAYGNASALRSLALPCTGSRP